MVDTAKHIKSFVGYKISTLVKSANDSASKATLAKLRRGIGKNPGSMPELWDITIKDLPESLLGNNQDPTHGEWAVHTALTLYALHQQGKDLKQQNMNKPGESLGTSLSKLVADEDDRKRIKRRFDAVSTANSMGEFAHHLRGLIQLLKAKSIPLDYAELAVDLYWLQSATARDSIRLKWGRDFYRVQKPDETNETNKNHGKEDDDGNQN